MARWWCVMAAFAVVAAGAVSGCGTVSERRDDVSAAVIRFENDVAARRAAPLCVALAPGTRQELEQSAKSRCEKAVEEEQLADGGDVRTVDVYGQQARAVLERDTVFLARFPQGWKVTAAGCQARPGLPYQCQVKGA